VQPVIEYQKKVSSFFVLNYTYRILDIGVLTLHGDDE